MLYLYELLISPLQTHPAHTLCASTCGRQAVITNPRRRNVLKDLVRVIQQEHHTYTDPITEFVECLLVRYDFDSAQERLGLLVRFSEAVSARMLRRLTMRHGSDLARGQTQHVGQHARRQGDGLRQERAPNSAEKDTAAKSKLLARRQCPVAFENINSLATPSMRSRRCVSRMSQT